MCKKERKKKTFLKQIHMKAVQSMTFVERIKDQNVCDHSNVRT